MLAHTLIRKPAVAASFRAGVLVLGGVALGFGVNAFHPRRAPLAPYEAAAVCLGSATHAPVGTIAADAAAKLCGDERTVVVDVRSAAAFAEGHVAHAMHLPCSGTDQDMDRVRGRLVAKHALVVYGDSDDQARKVANDLAARVGRPDLSIAVLAGGWPAWNEAGLACASGPCNECKEMIGHDGH